MLPMSGDTLNIQLNKLYLSKTEKVSSSRRDLSPSPCANKRRRYSEGCGNHNNMASQTQNSPIGSSLASPSSTAAAPMSTSTSPMPSSSLSSSSTSPPSSPSPTLSPPLISPTPQTSSSPQQQQQQQQTSQQPVKSNNYESLDKTLSNTLKRNPKMELSKTDLLKLLGYLEGELQARDIVITALKSEKMKYLLSSKYRSGTTDPHAALARDVAIASGVICVDENQTDRQVASLEALVTQQRRMQCRMAKVLKEMEIRHRTVVKELEEEKRKHEHDTAQGDDITYELEKERTRLKKELELERQEKKRLEMELKKESLCLEMEKSRQKQIVLLLLAERKKIIMKYIEERKRSEDLAQILSEEKVRIDSMAEGLEEESKKSLQMEAELEKQQAQFDMERQQYRQALAKVEKRNKELEADLEVMRTEMESWKGGATIRAGIRAPPGVTPPPPPAKPRLGERWFGAPMVSKVIQPTATVSSVPVSGPTTGIARSVTPQQAMRGVTYGSANAVTTPVTSITTSPTVTLINTNAVATSTPVSTTANITPGSNINANVPPVGGDPPASEPQTTEKRAPVPVSTPSTLSFHVAPTSGGPVTATKKPIVPRGVPPPVPPNKPVVPPKKEAVAYMRRVDPNQQIIQSSNADTIKINKQISAGSSTIQQPVQSAPGIISTHQIVEEGKPR